MIRLAGGLRGRRSLNGRRLGALELRKRRRRLLFSDPNRPEHRADGRLCDGAFEATLADRGEHLQHNADRRLQGKIHRKAATGKIVEHARQILLQTATRRFTDAWIGSRHARDERAPRRILERSFDEGVAAKATRSKGSEVEARLA